MGAADMSPGLVQHDGMSTPAMDPIRAANTADAAQLLALWALVFDGDDPTQGTTWRKHAHDWFTGVVEDRATAHFPVIAVDDRVVATAIGTLELGVPNPHCPRGRAVRLANLVTLPEHRGKGYGSLLVRDVVEWARSIEADRVDLSATPDGQRIYAQAGFNLTRAPRMKLVL